MFKWTGIIKCASTCGNRNTPFHIVYLYLQSVHRITLKHTNEHIYLANVQERLLNSSSAWREGRGTCLSPFLLYF